MRVSAVLRNCRLARLLWLRVWLGVVAALMPFGAQAQILPFGFPSCPLINLLCTINTVNVLGQTITVRRNDYLLGLDLGLDRQVDILAFDGVHDGNALAKPYGLGGPASQFRRGSSLIVDASRKDAVGEGSQATASGEKAFVIWAEGHVNWFNDNTGPFSSGGRSGVIYVGADYRLARNVLIGALVQFDQTDQDFDGLPSRLNSEGWMVGPYATMRLSSNLFFQARAAWGQAHSEIHADPNVQDNYDSDRWLVRGTLLGHWRTGAWQIRSRTSVGYIEDSRHSYLSSVGVIMRGESGSLGQAKAGAEVAYQYALANKNVIEPSLLLEGIWNFEQSAGSVKLDDLANGPDVRARAEAGVMVVTGQGLSFGASFTYDGIGSADFHAIGGKGRGRVPLN